MHPRTKMKFNSLQEDWKSSVITSHLSELICRQNFARKLPAPLVFRLSSLIRFESKQDNKPKKANINNMEECEISKDLRNLENDTVEEFFPHKKCAYLMYDNRLHSYSLTVSFVPVVRRRLGQQKAPRSSIFPQQIVADHSL